MRALCRGHRYPDLWFPTGHSQDKLTALSVCRVCPVRAECLAYALEMMARCKGDLYGIWGGTTEVERRGMLRTVVSPEQR